MRPVLHLAGRTIWWCGWPVMWLYLRDSERTRLVLQNEKGQVLVVKGWISRNSRWSLPGGGLHRGEDPVRGVVREACEEVGVILQPNEVRLLGNFTVNSKGFRFKLHCFTAVVSNAPKLRLQWYEIADAEWISVTNLALENSESDVMQALSLLAPYG